MKKVEIITRRKGFTLIELLVVISIIAVLLSVLMPALSRAKYIAKRLICLTRIKDQANSQFLYAADWDGKFSPNNGRGPQYMSSDWGTGLVDGIRTYEAMIDKYITNTDIMFCPLLKKFGYAYDTEYCWSAGQGGYGGWDIMEWSGSTVSGGSWNPETVTRPSEIESGFCWYANNRTNPDYLVNFSPLEYLDGEPPWPKNMEGCSSRAAFISHQMVGMSLNPLEIYHDTTHGGTYDPFVSFSVPVDESESEDTPVCYADGHVTYTKRSEMRPRANVPFGGPNYYWY